MSARHGGADDQAGGVPGAPSTSTFSSVISSTKAYLHPFASAAASSASAAPTQHTEHHRVLSDLAPHIMRPRILNAAANASGSVASAASSSQLTLRGSRVNAMSRYSPLSNPARSLIRYTVTGNSGPTSSTDLRILEMTDEILASDLPDPIGIADEVSLFRGFQATMPSALDHRSKRRKARGRDEPHLGLKTLGMQARGLLTETGEQQDDSGPPESVANKARRRKRRESKGVGGGLESKLSPEELKEQVDEIRTDKENLNVRRVLVNAEIAEVDNKIAQLEAIREGLRQSLLGLHEEELELNDELEGVSEILTLQRDRRAMPGASSQSAARSSRRRKGPAFLPSEHDDLPSGVAFMTLANHSAPITALDLSEPYGTLVSASLDESVRVWDLSTGDVVGRLRGHRGAVKCLQVEDELTITGSTDSTVRLWDLRRVEDYENSLAVAAKNGIGEDELAARMAAANIEGAAADPGEGSANDSGSAIRNSSFTKEDQRGDPCLRTLEGHSKAVTCLYFDDSCLVTGASDKTLRQWDLNTGQCILTMDILWAISNPSSSQALSATSAGGWDDLAPSTSPGRRSARSSLGYDATGLGSSVNFAGTFSHPTPPYADGSWEMYQDFVGGVQFWGYALASGSGDGGVRMWDMRTGQAHRTLLGHTAPVTCLQFDETYVISGSLDKSIRIWDLRTGAIADSIKYDYPVTALQFDTRKIVAATGENGIKIYNRTTLQHTSLTVNGHTSPAERLRYADSYLVSGGRDNTVKVWAL